VVGKEVWLDSKVLAIAYGNSSLLRLLFHHKPFVIRIALPLTTLWSSFICRHDDLYPQYY